MKTNSEQQPGEAINVKNYQVMMKEENTNTKVKFASGGG